MLNKLINEYLNSDDYRRLAGSTQNDYQRHLDNLSMTRVIGNRYLGNTNLLAISAGMLNNAYAHWVNQYGIRSANYMKSSLSVVWKYGMRRDYMEHNPVSLIKTISTPPRRQLWSRDEVRTFLSTAYSEQRWHGIGLIVHMAYEWGQRVGDMRTLTWAEVDTDQCRADLVQSKRNAAVHLPISANLCEMLKQQKEYFGFQKYVAPKYNIKKGLVRAYQKAEISPAINEILGQANLPPELTAMDLRRTAITEAVEAGVDLVGIMQFSGHQNPASVKPYLVNTFSGASAALAARNLDDEE